MKNKKTVVGLASATAVLILGASTLALFTAKDDSNFKAKAGTLGIEVDSLKMENPDNINPGDNDPSNPEDAVAGTEHEFEYTVENLGTKSARTRHTIILSVTENNSDKVLDARHMVMFGNDKELVEKSYVLEDNSEVSELKDGQFVKAIKYVFISDVFDGVGKDIKDGGSAEKENIENIVSENDKGKVEKTYTYDFGLLRTATNKYQEADFHIDVIVEAMQYRNTNESDWETVTRVERTYSTADVNGTYVPSHDEDKDGNKLSSEYLDHVFEKHTSEETVEPSEDNSEESSEIVNSETSENSPEVSTETENN